MAENSSIFRNQDRQYARFVHFVRHVYRAFAQLRRRSTLNRTLGDLPAHPATPT